MERAPPRQARFYRSSVRTVALDLPALTEIITQDTTKGLKEPDPAAVTEAMESFNVIMVRSSDSDAAALACSVMYDRGELADGRTLYEYGSVGAWRLPGYGLLPTMARCFSVQVQVNAADAVLIGIARMDKKVQNWRSLKQLGKAGFKPIGDELLAQVNAVRPIDPGRRVLVFDRDSACYQAQQLLAVVQAGMIVNRDNTFPDLLPEFDLSPISDGVLEDFIAQSCAHSRKKVG